MRRALILLAALVAVSLLLVSCAQNSATPQSEHEQQENKEIPLTAQIVCDQKGTRVLTPTVAARPDGVHFMIDNRLKATTGGYTVALPQSEGPLYSGAGGNAPRGISKHVEPFSPGTVKISCNPPRFSGEEEELDYVSFKVLKAQSGYKSAELECSGGGWVKSGGGFYAGGVKGKKGDPVEMTRQRFSDEIEEGDVVEIAGYPEIAHSQILEDSRYVRVVREGRVVAVMQYFREGGGWLEGEYSACERF